MLKRRWNGFLAGLTVLGGAVALLTLYPRMTITTDFDTTDPSKSSFLISNDGYLPVYSVRVHCLLNTLNMQNAPQISSRLPNGEKGEFWSAFDTGELPITTLLPGDGTVDSLFSV
jgi:hypothetical protein